MSQGMAKSIFEYLTYKNPELKHENRFKCTLSREDWWLTPKRLVPWEEFNFQTMMQMFGERLKTELMRNDRKLDYPAPKISLNAEGTVSGEDTAINILTRWTKPMVTAALEAVDDTFHPVFWVPPSLSRSPPIAAPKPQPEMVQGGEQPRRRSLRNRKGSMPTSDSKSRSRSRPPRPDGAGIHFAGLANSSVSQGNQQDSTTTRSRLACEIKPGSMWTSEALQIGHLVDENGYWLENRSNARDASPLVQVYNYCVNLDTRYGFLITSREILAVRVGPPLESRSPSSSKLSHERTEQKLNEMLYYHGVMEYAIIPWGNYRTKGKYENMTINLSLWVLCILAGQDYRPDWSYKALSEERLIVRDTPNQRVRDDDPVF
ncbi:hypothetical protein E0Z10_g2102 [Xylaria hypoxylon]|uniref:Uncharacterized protein n=1 Tax=Xylaria hypoxylon TaxID=37992 RepID=A0A4Z0Z5D8_9PEZI|nr:hypothetical protein E0Z10_g2102 [Xylaria hypoxylon]